MPAIVCTAAWDWDPDPEPGRTPHRCGKHLNHTTHEKTAAHECAQCGDVCLV